METEIVNKAVPVVLPINDWAQLKKQAKAIGRSASAIMRDLLAAYLQDEDAGAAEQGAGGLTGPRRARAGND